MSSGLTNDLSGSWMAEVERAFGDGVCRNEDSDWLHKDIQRLGKTKVN